MSGCQMKENDGMQQYKNHIKIEFLTCEHYEHLSGIWIQTTNHLILQRITFTCTL